MERLLPTGQYRKWNNNFGYVSDVVRNTPHAFSHFTYEASDHRILICDIQVCVFVRSRVRSECELLKA